MDVMKNKIIIKLIYTMRPLVKIGVLIIVFVATIFQLGRGQTTHSLLRNGDKKYKNEDYVASEEYYRKALEKKKVLLIQM
ncbi:MAG: hypothetical protein HC912_08410 [Saprospiraceae bacterium]|nr:hypothetical protein [Saprospiraceae bacterium]